MLRPIQGDLKKVRPPHSRKNEEIRDLLFDCLRTIGVVETLSC
jgi:hypothetical protein